MDKYDPLADRLRHEVGESCTIAFSDVDELVDGLPPSAWTHRPWWANSKELGSHARGWIDAGWLVEGVNLTSETVTFRRLADGDSGGALRRPLLLRALFEVLEEAEEPLQAGDALARVAERISLNPTEISTNASGYTRFSTFLRFASSWGSKVGWISKKGGWSVTEAGVDAAHKYSDGELYAVVTKLYRERLKEQDKGIGTTQRQERVLAALSAVEPGQWTSFTDLREALEYTDNQVYADVEALPARDALRVLKSDGFPSLMKNLDPDPEVQRAALRAEGVRFNESGAADQLQRVRVDALRDALAEVETEENGEADGVLQLTSATPELAATLHLDVDWLEECIELLRDRPQMIFYGPPGTGKTYIAQALARHLARDNIRLVQFHPAFAYEDFFEGYRPEPGGGFVLSPGPMRKIVDEARRDPTTPFVLIIDEINRGNLAKVFGELYFLLEYRDQRVDLLYGKDDGGFSLPPNVIIMGTMNTADRSIALVDAAMRRRFSFVPLHPSEPPTSGVLRSWLAESGRSHEVADLLDLLNNLIDDEDFKIGPSYFMRSAVHQPGGLERTWRTSILPLLEEHHYGELSTADVATRYGLAKLEATLQSREPQIEYVPDDA